MTHFAVHYRDDDGNSKSKFVAAECSQDARDTFNLAHKGKGYLIEKVKVTCVPAPVSGAYSDDSQTA
jgi:hypothetical protein